MPGLAVYAVPGLWVPIWRPATAKQGVTFHGLAHDVSSGTFTDSSDPRTLTAEACRMLEKSQRLANTLAV